MDPFDLLSRVGLRKRRRLLPFFFGSSVRIPSSEFLRALDGETSMLPDGTPSPSFAVLPPEFFAVDIELDAVFASFSVRGSDPDRMEPVDDRRGFLELDGITLDAALARKLPDGSVDLVLFAAKTSGKWAARRFRRISDRLRRVFGEDGRALGGVQPRFVALGPERPGPAQTTAWPRWMCRADGASRWIEYGKNPQELAIVRCDKKGRPRRVGEYWKLS